MNTVRPNPCSLAQEFLDMDRQGAGLDPRKWYDCNEYWTERYWKIMEEIIADEESLATAEASA